MCTLLGRSLVRITARTLDILTFIFRIFTVRRLVTYYKLMFLFSWGLVQVVVFLVMSLCSVMDGY
jgi:hypothetical protein